VVAESALETQNITTADMLASLIRENSQSAFAPSPVQPTSSEAIVDLKWWRAFVPVPQAHGNKAFSGEEVVKMMSDMVERVSFHWSFREGGVSTKKLKMLMNKKENSFTLIFYAIPPPSSSLQTQVQPQVMNLTARMAIEMCELEQENIRLNACNKQMKDITEDYDNTTSTLISALSFYYFDNLIRAFIYLIFMFKNLIFCRGS
jgi:hypothetical protein